MNRAYFNKLTFISLVCLFLKDLFISVVFTRIRSIFTVMLLYSQQIERKSFEWQYWFFYYITITYMHHTSINKTHCILVYFHLKQWITINGIVNSQMLWSFYFDISILCLSLIFFYKSNVLHYKGLLHHTILNWYCQKSIVVKLCKYSDNLHRATHQLQLILFYSDRWK